MNKNILRFIKKNKKMDINELIKILKKHNKKIFCFPIKEQEWSDFGMWDTYYKEAKRV